MQRAYDRVVRNKGAPDGDVMPVGELKSYLQQNWPVHRKELLRTAQQILRDFHMILLECR